MRGEFEAEYRKYEKISVMDVDSIEGYAPGRRRQSL